MRRRKEVGCECNRSWSELSTSCKTAEILLLMLLLAVAVAVDVEGASSSIG